MKKLLLIATVCLSFFGIAQECDQEASKEPITYRMQNTPMNSFPSAAELDTLLQTNKASFIVYGIASPSQNIINELNKFNVSVQFRGCMTSPMELQEANRVNTYISKFLTKTYGMNWQEKTGLDFLP